jgi:IS5 family transposase
LAVWNAHAKSGKRGHPQTYTDAAILCMASLQELYHLPLRATQGLLCSVVKLLSMTVSVPCYTTLSRRRRTLEISLPKRAKSAPLHMVVDSTGVKIYGEGEWKVRQHGWTRRRTWRKLHVGVDEATAEIRATVVTTNNFGDGQVLPDLLAHVEDELSQVTGDGGYDDRQCYDAIRERGARAVIPPQKGARIWHHGNSKHERHARDENVRSIRRHGRAKWKREPLPPALCGRDDDVPIEDNLWRESHGALLRRTSSADAREVCGLESDDASGNAAEFRRVSDVDSQLWVILCSFRFMQQSPLNK